MRYLALAVDYDNTLARDGALAPAVVQALERLRTSGRRAILVTGRRLEDLLAICPHLALFDYAVVENGAVAYDPRSTSLALLAPPPPPQFAERLAARGVNPLEIGHVIVGTHVPHQTTVLEVVQELGLELQVIFNREAVMVLPPGVNKASGLAYALRELDLSPHEAVGVGDAENDHSFLARCECAVAVANAVPALRESAMWVTAGAAGDGVIEVIDRLIDDDLADLQCRTRYQIAIGSRADGEPVMVPPYGSNILIAGPSGSGKSTIAVGIVERLMAESYQVCIIDPEGDYGTLHDVITLGSPCHPVTPSEVLSALEDPLVNLNVNLLGLPLSDRPAFFGQLLPNLQAMRSRTGRPHWIVLDEAHHMLPVEWGHAATALAQSLGETVLVTVHPDRLSRASVAGVDVVIAVGERPEDTLTAYAHVSGRTLDWPSGLAQHAGGAVVWFAARGEPPFRIRVLPARSDRLRHLRKYAEGNMRYHSFYFRGPHGRQNIKAHNLAIFSQIAEGIDEETWLYHLHRGDYARWFREAVKDDYLAHETELVQGRRDLPAAESRRLIRDLIDTRYTLPE